MHNYDNPNTYPADIQPIIRVLLAYETSLSDGYGYYSGSETRETLTEIAQQILVVIRDRKGE